MSKTNNTFLIPFITFISFLMFFNIFYSNKAFASELNPEEQSEENIEDEDSVALAKELILYNDVVYKIFDNRAIVLSCTGKTADIAKTIKHNGKKYKVTTIRTGAFKNSKIKKVVIGENIEVIKNEAFLNCIKLKSIVIKSKKLQIIGENAFWGTKKMTIKVPKKSKARYKELLNNKGLTKSTKIK